MSNRLVISFLNKKGGVGKTTIASNLAQCLALIGKKVLLIDNDEQHNLSMSLGLRKLPAVTLDILYEKPYLLPDAVVTTFLENLDCICGSSQLAMAKPKKTALKDLLASKILDEVGYEFIIIDNGPSVDEKVLTAINASDCFVIPLTMKYFSLQGLKEMVDRLEKAGVTKDQIVILRNEMKAIMQYRATALAVETLYPENTLKTCIPYDDMLDTILEDTKNLILSRSKSKAGLAIIDLVEELLGIEKTTILDAISELRKKNKIENARHLNKFRFSKIKNDIETNEVEMAKN